MISRRTFIAAGSASVLGATALNAVLTGPAFATSTSVTLTLKNTSGLPAYAYIYGHNAGSWMFVGEGGNLRPLTSATDYAIEIPAGQAKNIPLGQYLTDGRIYFSLGSRLVNDWDSNGAIRQPGYTADDQDWLKAYTFFEFNFDTGGLHANISYVDMVSLPVRVDMTNTSSQTQSVQPLPNGAPARIAADLLTQHGADGLPWDQLVIKDGGGKLVRVMSPEKWKKDLFGDYYRSYVDAVWSHYRTNTLTVTTNSGSYTGQVTGDVLTFAGLNGSPFTKPATADILSCNSGPFANSNDERGAVSARLGAAFNRGTLLLGDNQPNGVPTSQYYSSGTVNQYARLVHTYATIGYAFPFDDVHPAGSPSIEGYISDPDPATCTITLGDPGNG
ncbi:beta-1,3-glucanase family protein [Streptomyces sp. NPDC052040]|uniref:beta-1,3-glucanase family protein n=1 Tax=unclassified Streptomyces TaxID=2593676 RepID=UPI0037CE3904